MLQNGLPSLSLEKISLYFLSLILDEEFDSTVPMCFTSDIGSLQFTGVDLLQERGKLPLLILDFMHSEDAVKILYFGHISPFKLQSVEFCKKCAEPEKFCFTGTDAAVADLVITDFKGFFPQNIDYKIVLGSLFLWRSCIGLSKVCESSLGKYFSKMKSVSRYKWEMNEYFVKNGSVCEKWSAMVTCCDSVERKVNVFFEDGVVVSAE